MVAKTFLLVGPDRFLQDRALSRLRAAGASAGAAIADVGSYDAEIHPAGEVLDFLRTAGFFSASRLAVLRQAEHLSAEDRERILRYVRDPERLGTLVLVFSEGSLKKDPYLKSLSEHCETVPCLAPFENELPAWVSRHAVERGLKIEPRAAHQLVERLGKDLAALDDALEKLALFAHPRTQISVGDVEALIGRSVEDDVYALTEALLDRNPKRTFETLRGLVRDGVRAPEIVGALASQIERIDRIVRWQRSGLGEAEIASRIGGHPFYLKKLFARSRQLRTEDSARLLESLLECDETVKTGKMDETLALERMLLGAFAAKGGAA